MRLGDVTLEVGVSIGIAGCVTGDDPLAVLQRADVAMYRAKRQRTGHAVYGSGDDEERRNSVKVAAELRHAIDRGDLVVHYQPKIELGTGLVGLGRGPGPLGAPDPGPPPARRVHRPGRADRASSGT